MDSKKFTIEFDPKEAKEFRKFYRNNPSLIPRISRAIDSLILSPLQGKSLTGNKKGCYSLREGDYRIIYEVYPTQGVVHIIRIGHRREVYR
ncbi:MAG: type II toxin-antitoxin system RelE/ParE family toxin [Candidatus Omnitrophica bacterium]|nr:type II toxin-antitoxin system RelE/ParE family toxin [Candidatus Omnitrophota bacterium]